MSELSANELKTLAYKKVKEMIISQQLLPGQKIVQDKLAATLGISRTPLRGALQMLEAEHLIKSIPRRGVVVQEISDERIIEIYDCRIALEGMAVKSFAERATTAQINKLQRFFRAYRDSDKKIDHKSYQAEDTKFHDFLIASSGNDFLKQLFQQGNLLVAISQIGLIREPEETLNEHFAIIQAISDKNPDQAERLIKEHLLISKELVIKKFNMKKEENK